MNPLDLGAGGAHVGLGCPACLYQDWVMATWYLNSAVMDARPHW